jgi:hypothetical protein
MGKNFVIFFDEKEGTSPLCRLLDNFEGVSVVHQIDNRGWEPFDAHNCGPMPLENFTECLGIIFGGRNMEALNRIYCATGNLPLENIESAGSVGFKMRFRAPDGKSDPEEFKKVLIRLLRDLGIVVFIAVRRDLLRWSLSKYHGDGTGKPGHLQFKLAKGDIAKEDIGKIHVDPAKLDLIIKACEAKYRQKKVLLSRLESSGVAAYPLFYEEFLKDKVIYFDNLLGRLGIRKEQSEIEWAIGKGAYFEKVHAIDISSFVENHEEIEARFGGLADCWEQPMVSAGAEN